MKYLITGGAGFIGSHLADALVDRGDSVIALDNLATGRMQNIGHLEDHERFEFVQGSVLDDLLVDELVRTVDVVLHLAASVGVQLIVRQPLRSLLTNIKGSEIIFGAAHRYRKKVLVTSTSEVYGKNSNGPLSETADRVLGSPAIPRWGYSTSKAVDEMLAFAYHRERGLPTVVVRLFNTVGPRQTGAYGMVLPRFANQAVRGEDVTVFGDGSQTRCFCHVADAVRAIVSLVDDARAEGQAFNVGGEEEISILHLAQRVIAEARSESKLRFIPYEAAYGEGFEDLVRRVPDTTRLRQLTGWSPGYSLIEVISEVIAEARRPLESGEPSMVRRVS